MSGRPSLLQKLIQQDPEKGEERFRYLAGQIEAKKVSLEKAAKLLNTEPKTLKRNLEKLRKVDVGRIFALPLRSWKDMPEGLELENWLRDQLKGDQFSNHFRRIVRIWETVWEKKPLSALTEQDFIKAKREIEASPLNKFNPILSLRYVIRGGFGNPGWLNKFLRTKGLKGKPRMAPELMIKERFVKVAPTVLSNLYSMGQQNVPVRAYETLVFVTPELARATALAFNLKRVSGIRTGDRATEKELWGTRIGTGQSRILLDSEGRFQLWEVFAKKDEVWTIRKDTIPSGVVKELEDYIRECGLKQGDFLLSDKRETIRAVLKEACVRGGLVPLALHDLRKYYGTALALSGIPLEVAIDLNVGWKSIQVLKDHYLMIKGINAEKEALKLAKFLELEASTVDKPEEPPVQVS